MTTAEELRALHALADTLLREGRRDDAAVLLGGLAALAPTDPRPLVGLARVAADAGRWGDAVAFATEALARRPGDPEAEAWLRRGWRGGR